MQLRQLGAEFFGRTDGHDENNSHFRKIAKATKNQSVNAV